MQLSWVFLYSVFVDNMPHNKSRPADINFNYSRTYQNILTRNSQPNNVVAINKR